MKILQDIIFALIIVLSVFGTTFYIVECVIGYKENDYSFLWERRTARIVYAIALLGLLIISTLMFSQRVRPVDKFERVPEQLYRRI